MTTENDNVEFQGCLIFLCSILFFRHAMEVRAIYIAYLKNNIERKKIKTCSELTTSSLSVVIIELEISHKFHDNDTGNSQYDGKTSILLLLRDFKLFSAILIILVSQYLPDEIIRFCSRPIGLLVRNF